MNQAQKIIKYLAIAFGLYLAINIIGWVIFGIFSIAGISKIAEISQEDITTITYSQEFEDVENLDFEIKYAQIYVKAGETLKIEADKVNDDWKINKDGKTLKISNVGKSWNINNEIPILVIYLPEELQLNKVEIESGAGETNIEYLNSKSIELNLGAGKVSINNIASEKASIECGAGEVIIKNADLTNVRLEAGIGRLEYSGYIRGISNIECGIGELDLNLAGGEIYSISAEKGIGEITINGESIKKDAVVGNGENKIDIEGGIGAIKVKIEDTNL